MPNGGNGVDINTKRALGPIRPLEECLIFSNCALSRNRGLASSLELCLSYWVFVQHLDFVWYLVSALGVQVCLWVGRLSGPCALALPGDFGVRLPVARLPDIE